MSRLSDAQKDLFEIETKYANCVAKIKQHTDQLAIPVEDVGGQGGRNVPNANNIAQIGNQQMKTLEMFEALRPKLAGDLVQARIAAGVYQPDAIIAAMERK